MGPPMSTGCAGSHLSTPWLVAGAATSIDAFEISLQAAEGMP